MRFIQNHCHWVSLALLLIISSLILLRFDRPLVRGDGIAYFAWLDTLVLDGDINLNNQFERFEPVNTYQITWNATRQRWVIIFPFGTAFLHAPFYLMGHWFTQNDWLNANPDYFYQMQGIGLPYSLFVMFGTNLMVLAALAFLWDLIRRMIGSLLAALIPLALLVGTPLIYYSTVEPLNSHSPSAFALTISFYLFFRRTYLSDVEFKVPWREILYWALMGIFAGLAVLVRWQLLLAVTPMWLILLYKREWRGFFVSGIALSITMLPLFIIWNAMFGSPITVPFDEVSDESFLTFTDNAWWQVLTTTLIYSPITLISFIGLGTLLWSRRWIWAIFFALVIGAQLFINGSALDWYAGYSYGMRRMTELFPIYGTLIAIFIRTMLDWKPDYTRIIRIISAVVFVLFIGYGLLYFVAFLDFIWTHPDSWAGSLLPNSVIPYLIDQPHRQEILNSLFQTHLGPPSWTMPGP